MNKNKSTVWLYGNKASLGWGSTEHDATDYTVLDYDPEFESKRDVKLYWRNRSHILALPKMSFYRYVSTLLRGLMVYRRLE